MSFRPASQSSQRSVALDYEIAQEQASALGRLGRALEAALAALVEYDRLHGEDCSRREPTAKRAQLVQDAGEALWCFMVQREACGLRDPRPVLGDYRVPAEVQNRMGIFVTRRR
jgi:hypothetical protein